MVPCGRISPVRFRTPHQRRPGNLHNSRDNVRSNEAPQNQLRLKPPSHIGRIANGRRPRDQAADTDVNTRRDEDRSDDDEEVLHHEPDDVVRVVLRGEAAEDIAEGFEQAGEG